MIFNNIKKLSIGWFSFSCCEDSTIVFTELLNDYFFDWKRTIDFKYINVLKSKNILSDIDVAFIEGAITSEADAEKLKYIRNVSKYIVAVGSCAVTGLPSGQRNQFDEDTKACIQYLIDRFGQSQRVLPLSEIIAVDEKIPGCPMDEKRFLEVLFKYLAEFGIK